MDPDLPPETREAPPGPVGLSVVARVLAPLVINHSTQIFLEEAVKTSYVKLNSTYLKYRLQILIITYLKYILFHACQFGLHVSRILTF